MLLFFPLSLTRKQNQAKAFVLGKPLQSNLISAREASSLTLG
jgi:hypothetical protein